MAVRFVQACGAEDPTAVQEQLLWGADVNSRASYGVTGLIRAIGRNRIKIVHLLLSRHDIDVNATDLEGMSPLHYAAWHDRVDILTTLLADSRLNVNARTDDGSTPLLSAVDNNSADSVKLLLSDPRIDPNIKFEFPRCGCYRCRTERSSGPHQPGSTLTYGGSPLMWAVKRGLEECTRILLTDPRVNIMTTDSFKRSSAQVAR